MNEDLTIKGKLELETASNVFGAVQCLDFDIDISKLNFDLSTNDFLSTLNENILEHYSKDENYCGKINKIYIDINRLSELLKTCSKG